MPDRDEMLDDISIKVPDLSDRDLDLDMFYDMLSNTKRRYVIGYIAVNEDYDRVDVAYGLGDLSRRIGTEDEHSSKPDT